jgi:hypothetical protein
MGIAIAADVPASGASPPPNAIAPPDIVGGVYELVTGKVTIL